jgi:hypothetical protein
MKKMLVNVSLATAVLFAVPSVVSAGGKGERKDRSEKHQKAEKGEAGKKAPKDKVAAPAAVTLSGTVRLNKDEKTGALKGITIIATDGFEYQVRTSPEAKVLETMDGQEVEVTGKAGEKRGGEKWLQIKTVNAGAKAAPGAADGAKAIDKAL